MKTFFFCCFQLKIKKFVSSASFCWYINKKINIGNKSKKYGKNISLDYKNQISAGR